METKDYITVLAVLISPLLAVQADKFIEKIRNNRNRKVVIFKTLMATRGSKLSAEHVIALNQIDLEFQASKKYLKVLHAWKEYFDQLCVKFDSEKEGSFDSWNDKAENLLVNLLFEMGISLGYTFDRVTIRRNIYSPTGHTQTNNEMQAIRSLLIKVLSGENAITTLQVSPDNVAELNNEAQNKQAELQSLLIEFYKSEKPLNVKINK